MSAPTTDRGGSRVPALSVVIASSHDAALLSQCVEALAPQAASHAVEVIVVRAADLAAGLQRQDLAERVPGLRWIDAAERSTVPHLRGLGMAAARAERIALLEDDCVVAADWCRHALSVGDSAAAVGGAVEPGSYRKALDWAVYFCEYGRFMLPVPASVNAPLTGNNVVYSRAALAALPAAVRSDFREAFVHAQWQRMGTPTLVTGKLIVHNVNAWSIADVTSGPFHHGRAYAAERFAARSRSARAGIAALTLGLPFLKTGRVLSETLGRKRHLGRLALAFPWILLFVTSWSAGELAGSLWGPGTSPARWR